MNTQMEKLESVLWSQFKLIFLMPLSEIMLTFRNNQNARLDRTHKNYEAMELFRCEGRS